MLEDLLDLKYVNNDGDTMTGPLVLPGDPVLANEAACKHYVDLVTSLLEELVLKKDGSVQLTANWNAGNFQITIGSVVTNQVTLDHIFPLTGGTINIHGLITLSGGFLLPVNTFPVNDATPSVAAGSGIYRTANTLATTITNFDDLAPGTLIILIFRDGNTSVAEGGNINLQGPGLVPFTGAAGDTMVFASDDGVTAQAISQSVN